MAPVFSMAELNRNKNKMVMVASLLNPAIPSLMFTSPLSISMDMEIMAVISIGIFSHANINMVNPTISNTRIIGSIKNRLSDKYTI